MYVDIDITKITGLSFGIRTLDRRIMVMKVKDMQDVGYVQSTV